MLSARTRIYEEANKVKQSVSRLIAANANSQELMVLANKLIKDHSKALHLYKTSGSRPRVTKGAYEAGYKAGGRVDIHKARNSKLIA